ncbi:MAG: RCC1 domain-containing protein [Marmoricola sp.]
MTTSMRTGRILSLRAVAVIAAGITVVALSAAPSQAALVTRSITFSAPSSALTSAKITVSGKVTHSPKGTLVSIQRASGKSWVGVSNVRTTTTTGAYSAKFYVPKTRGKYTYRAVSPATSKLARVISVTRSIIVRTPSTATLVSPTTTATSGQVVTLTGKVTPVIAHRAIALQRRVSPSTTWTKIASLVTTSTGAWSRGVAPAAQAVTQYRVVASVYGYYAGATSPVASIATAPAIGSVPDATVNTYYSKALATTDQRAGTWAITVGTLPAGLALTNGVISGTPTTVGTSIFTLSFTDTYGYNVTKQITMSVDALGSTPSAPQVAAGGLHTCRVSTAGVLQCWGDDSKGELGINGDTLHHPSVATPQTVSSTVAWQQVSTSPSDLADDTCAIKIDHSLWCWGYDSNGEAGQGGTAQYNAPVQVLPGTHWSTVAVGGTFACGVRTDGTLWCWGAIGTGSSGSAPAQVGTATTWSNTLVAGYGHACALDTAAHLYCWGLNYGWIGDGTSGSYVTAPEKILASAKWSDIAAGPGNTCGVRSDSGSAGTLWCWGSNNDGQLGNGTTGGSAALVPTQVGTQTDWSSVTVNGAGNSNHVCALNQSSAIYCWGSDSYGEVGQTPASPYVVNSPALFAPSSSIIWASVSAGGYHTCATSTGGNTYCWGDPANGQLGVSPQPSGPQTSPLQVQ